MTPERWQLVKDVFDGALRQDASLRSTYLDRLCSDDPFLRKEVETMLASDEQADQFMEDPAADFGAERSSDNAERMSRIGSRLVHYRILSELGSGGMGRVYLAEDTRLGRKLALKVLGPEWLDSPGAHMRFQREARLAAALDHPNICTIYDVGEDDGVSFIAMQFLDGETLKDLLRAGPLSVTLVLLIASQVADALATAHARGIVHCDVKPANVIVSPDGRAHVLDFGIARLLAPRDPAASNPAQRQSGMVFGTAAYLSPEQARGAALDHRSDVFSFGALLYEMATGRVPFGGASAADTISAILKEPHPSPSGINPELPPALLDIIDRALAKDPEHRYQSVDELKADLLGVAEQARTSPPALMRTSVAPDGAVPRRVADPRHVSSPAAGRSAWFTRRNVVAITIALVVAAGLAIGARYGGFGSGETIGTIAVLPFGHQQDTDDLEYLSDGLVERVIARLSELPATRVIARSTAFVYKGRPFDPQTIGHELGVHAVVTGDVSRQRETVIIRIELVDVNTGSRLWGNEYKRPISELSVLPGEVALAVAAELRTRLSSDQRRRLARDYTRSPDAYQLYLKGRFFWNKRTADGYAKAIDLFTAAVTAEPSFALAYSGLADAYLLLRGYGIRSPDDVMPKARAAAERAIQIDDSLAEAYTSLGKVESDTNRWAEADAAFRRAIALNPSYATAHHWYAMHLAQVGRLEEGLAAIRRAQALDPLSLIVSVEVGRLLYFSRQYDAAIAEYSKILEMDPDFALAHLHLGMVLTQKGAYSNALAEFERATPVGGLMPVVGRARTYALAGRKQDAEEILHALLEQSNRQFVPPYAMALLYVSLRDDERAIDWLEKGARDGGAWFLKVNPPFDPLQSNPRYQAIVRQIGLVPRL